MTLLPNQQRRNMTKHERHKKVPCALRNMNNFCSAINTAAENLGCCPSQTKHCPPRCPPGRSMRRFPSEGRKGSVGGACPMQVQGESPVQQAGLGAWNLVQKHGMKTDLNQVSIQHWGPASQAPRRVELGTQQRGPQEQWSSQIQEDGQQLGRHLDNSGL